MADYVDDEDLDRVFSTVEEFENKWLNGSDIVIEDALMETDLDIRDRLRGELVLSAALTRIGREAASPSARSAASLMRLMAVIRPSGDCVEASDEVVELDRGEYIDVNPGELDGRVVRPAGQGVVIRFTRVGDNMRIAAE